MNLLTHIFLPLVPIYVLKKKAFRSPYHFLLALFGILPDLDKFIGRPLLFHSLVPFVPLILVILLVEKLMKGRGLYTGIIAFFIGSHLLLDFLDGDPIPFLYPFSRVAIGLEYPIKIVFHNLRFSFLHEPFRLIVYTMPRTDFGTYGLLSGTCMASLILFVLVYLGMRRR